MNDPEAADPVFEALSKDDADVVEALFASGFNPESVGQDQTQDREKARRLVRLLSLLDQAPASAPDASLADVAFARVLQVRRSQEATPAEPILSELDQSALDAFVMQGFEAAGTPSALRARARKHELLAALLTGPVPTSGIDAQALAERTLARVQYEIEDQSGRLQLDVRPRRRSLRLADIASVAAVLLIGSGVLMPVLGSIRDQNQRMACLSNLGSTAMAFGAYAGANRDALPVVTAGLGNGKWWDVGQPTHSNSANLYTLVSTGYASLNHLACPGNPTCVTASPDENAHDWRRLEEVSYSYQLMFGKSTPRWNDSRRTVILADRSPVVRRSVRGEMFDPLANAPNHRRRGQHLLWNDGSSSWATTPVLASGDNIWLTRGAQQVADLLNGEPLRPLNGTETPDGPDDVCLGP